MTNRRRRTRRGFTLIELMVVVAIIGLLAAIAVPSFSMLRARARRAEFLQNMTVLVRDVQTFYRINGRVPGGPAIGWSGWNPVSGVAGQDAAFDYNSGPVWQDLARNGSGGIQRSRVRFAVYGAQITPTSPGYLIIYAMHDFDGDGQLGYSYTMLTSQSWYGGSDNNSEFVRYDTWLPNRDNGFHVSPDAYE